MLGMSWFPATLGGLNRYYRALLEQLPEASGVVIGPADDAPASIRALDDAATPLARRLLDFWLATRCAGRDAELIDAHFALYAAAPVLLGTLQGRPLVFHFHGPWAQENVAAGNRSHVAYVLRMAIERLVMRRADAHVVLSSAFRRELVERYRVRPWNVHVWTPGVALERFTPGDRPRARKRFEIAEGAFVAVCVRRLVPRMGLDVLLNAWGLIGAELPPGSQLLIVGDGSLHAALQRRASEPALAGRVQILGRLSEDDLVEAYRAADVAIVPSVSLEGFGLVVPEAAACGTPSIVTDVGGLPEVIAKLDRSLVVAADDATALGERVAAAAQGELPARTDTRSFAESFSWAQLADRHRALYRQLMSGTRDERMRVVYLDHVARLSGGEIQLLRLLPRFERVHPHVILAEDGPLAQRLMQAGVSVEVLALAPAARDLRREVVRPGGASPMVALHTLAYIVRLALRLRALKPDLVHTNSLKAGVYGSIAARATRIPVVWHVRDRIAADYIPRPAVWLMRLLVRRLADGVVANSDATLQTLPPSVRYGQSWVIPPSVQSPPDRYARGTPSPNGTPETPGASAVSGTSGRPVERGGQPGPPHRGPLTFGMLGRIAPWKGQDLFLRAFAAAFADGEERATIVGAPMFGEESYERELHGLVERLGIAERVQFTGFREDVWPELAEMDVLVHASTVPEPFGTVVLEGMAAGLAVIAPDEGGPATVIADGQTGRLFKSRDRDSLSAAMRALSADPDERLRLGSAARQTAQEYDPGVLAGRLERVYEQVLAGRLQDRSQVSVNVRR